MWLFFYKLYNSVRFIVCTLISFADCLSFRKIESVTKSAIYIYIGFSSIKQTMLFALILLIKKKIARRYCWQFTKPLLLSLGNHLNNFMAFKKWYQQCVYQFARNYLVQKITFEVSNFFCFFFCWCNCNCIFIHQVVLARRERRNLSVFESSCHLSTCLLHTVEASHCPYLFLSVKQKSCIPILLSLVWPDRELNPNLPFQ